MVPQETAGPARCRRHRHGTQVSGAEAWRTQDGQDRLGQSSTWAKLPHKARVTPAPTPRKKKQHHTHTMIQHRSEQERSSAALNAMATSLCEQLTNPRDVPRLRGHPSRDQTASVSAPEQLHQLWLSSLAGRVSAAPQAQGPFQLFCTKPCNSNQTLNPFSPLI